MTVKKQSHAAAGLCPEGTGGDPLIRGWDGITAEVRFKGGSHYRYKAVPAEAHAALIGAESVGKHFHAHVRGQYEHEKIA